MDNRSWETSAAAGAPSAPGAPSAGYPTDGNPSLAVPATIPGAYWFHQHGEELRAVLVAAGITPSNTTLNQLAVSIQTGKLNSASAGGTADAITATFQVPVLALISGMPLVVRAASGNATTTPTFTPNSGTIAAKTIVKGNNLPLAVGDIAGAGHWLQLNYDSTLDKFVLQNPAKGIVVTGTGTLSAGTPLIMNPYVASNTQTQAHGLASIPIICDVTLECVTAELGYSIGDKIDLSASGWAVGGTSSSSIFVAGTSIRKDATNIQLITSGLPTVVHKTGYTAIAQITAANWKLTITPYRLN